MEGPPIILKFTSVQTSPPISEWTIPVRHLSGPSNQHHPRFRSVDLFEFL